MSRMSDKYKTTLISAAHKCKEEGLSVKQAMDKLKKDYPKSNHQDRRGVVRHAYGLTKLGKAKAA